MPCADCNNFYTKKTKVAEPVEATERLHCKLSVASTGSATLVFWFIARSKYHACCKTDCNGYGAQSADDLGNAALHKTFMPRIHSRHLGPLIGWDLDG